ncbi:MAG: N-6 DNA methylase [Candidatus Paceibacterota bacterium]
MQKKQLGQFFTTNSDYILQGFEKFIKGKNITDPFAGSQDLMKWAKKHETKSVIGFDVDKQLVDKKEVFFNDSLNNPREYDFVITNPPYLHKNKADSKTKSLCFSGSNSIFEDLYQVSLKAISKSNEGIVVVPLNFLSAENSEKIREIFFDKFKITKLNIFTEQVFDDTTYNVISFHYKKKEKKEDKMVFDAHIFPNDHKVKIELNKNYGWQLGGEFISKINSAKNILGIYRLTVKDLKNGPASIRLAFNNIKDIEEHRLNSTLKDAIKSNVIFLRAIDSKNGKKIQLEDIRKYNVFGLIGKETSRNMAYLMFKRPLPIEEQLKLIKLFNEELQEAREKHLSLFLTNFRDNNRKRISFDFTYKLLNYIYSTKIDKSISNQPAFNF